MCFHCFLVFFGNLHRMHTDRGELILTFWYRWQSAIVCNIAYSMSNKHCVKEVHLIVLKVCRLCLSRTFSKITQPHRGCVNTVLAMSPLEILEGNRHKNGLHHFTASSHFLIENSPSSISSHKGMLPVKVLHFSPQPSLMPGTHS